MSNRFVKIAFTSVWAVVIAICVVLWSQSELALQDIPEALDAWLSQFGLWRAALVYIILYTVRPLILFPATILTVSSGLLFGPWLGILFTTIGENASANFAFLIARWLGRKWVDEREGSRIHVWDERIRENALMSVLIMRLVYMPFDAVNYGCGLTSMRHRDYFVGTFIGILPALITFVLLGGAGAAGVENRYMLFGSALFFFAVGLIVAGVLRRTSPVDEETPTDTPQSV